jgi:hypothetical protein
MHYSDSVVGMRVQGRNWDKARRKILRKHEAESI